MHKYHFFTSESIFEPAWWQVKGRLGLSLLLLEMKSWRKVSMAITIRSLGEDIPCFFHLYRRQLSEVGYIYQPDNSCSHIKKT